MTGRKFLWSWISILVMSGCIDPVPLNPTDYRENIVIEGFLSTEPGIQEINISKTSPINQQRFNGEQGATVWVTDDEGSNVSFIENSPGRYQATTSGIPDKKYTLHVTLANNKKYISDEVTLRKTPPIEHINAVYKKPTATTSDGIYFSVDTGDPLGQTRNYRWTFDYTYQIQTPFPSNFEWLGGNTVEARTVPVNICWASDTSRNILISSTNGFTEDRVVDYPLYFMPVYDYAMRIKFSLNVNQYSMTPAGYSYWRKLQKINESQGSLYDIQPGAIAGNIHSLDDDKETVLGYFDACEVSSIRVFYSPEDFNEQGYKRPQYLTSCSFLIPYEVSAGQIGAFMAEIGSRNDLVISEAFGAYDATLELRPRRCCDCTSNGTNIKPSFWP